jgi:hypothetical protein
MIVASDDPHVQETARTMPRVADVTYIEKGESFWCVAPDVKELLEKIDEWLVSLNPELPEEALAWGMNVEGGLTKQRVQDALLLIHSYMYLFSAFSVREAHTIVDPSSVWDDQVLEACAEANALSFQKHKMGVFKTWKSALRRTFLPLAKAGYRLFHEILLGAGRPGKPDPQVDLEGAILFQLCSSLQKHVDNVKHIMIALVEHGEHPVGLCWSAGGRIAKPTGFDQLTAKGIKAIPLERFVSSRDILSSFWHTLVILIKARQRLSDLDSLRYESVQLAPLLDEAIKYFIIADVPQRLRYAWALLACLGDSRPIAIKPWGGSDFFEGKLALRWLHNGEGPLYIHYWVGAGMTDWPYTDVTFKPDLFLAKSHFEAGLAEQRYGMSKSQIEVVGQARFAHLGSFAAENPVEKSRGQLGLPLDGNLYVGIDPGGALRGYQTYREQMELLDSVLSAVQDAFGLVIAIKPHPSHSIEHLMPLIKSYNCKSVVVLSKTAPVEHFLNAIDVFVTKFSTLILEAALLGRCAISAIFDQEDRFKVFGDLPALVESGIELKDLLIQLSSDEKTFENWKSEQLSRQEELLSKYYSSVDNPSSAAAERIVRDLRRDREIEK